MKCDAVPSQDRLDSNIPETEANMVDAVCEKTKGSVMT